MINRSSNLGSSMEGLFPRLHQNQQVHIAICCRRTISIGTEKDYLLRAERAHNLLDNLMNILQIYHCFSHSSNIPYAMISKISTGMSTVDRLTIGYIIPLSGLIAK